jgi:anti-sigma factor RsiW
VLGWFGVVEYRAHNSLSSERAALATEACDLHIATLAANQPPQIVSSDRHTVKPWFQGKLPFSFNLPETLPADTTLDGANLAYLHDHPVAQLLFSIGRHRVSVFAAEKNGGGALGPWKTTHDGFQVAGFETDDLEVIAVSDVDPARMATLINALQAAQTPH